MFIPKNGRVVIIDDNLNQAAPLIRALSMNKIPFTYHSEKKEQLPNQPYSDIRLIFLDINLTEGVHSEAAISSQLQTTLTRLITPGTPYIAAIWSTKENQYRDLLDDLFTNKIPDMKPLTQISLAKHDLFEYDMESGNYLENKNVDLVKEVNSRLSVEINKINAFKALVAWENVIHDCTEETIHQFANIVTNDEFWHQNLKHIFYKMAHAQLGKTILDADEPTVLQAALKTLTTSFEGKVEARLNLFSNMPDTIGIKKDGIYFNKNIDGKIVKLEWEKLLQFSIYLDNVKKNNNKNYLNLKGSNAAETAIIDKFKNLYKHTSPKLNSELLISYTSSPMLFPGNIYKRQVTGHLRRKLLKTYFPDVEKKTKGKFDNRDLHFAEFIELECTPLCDYSQKKRLRTRILPGLLFKASINLKVDQVDSMYLEIPSFEFRKDIYRIIFDYRMLKSHNINDIHIHPEDYMFKLKSEVVTDILARISAHVNRPGITTIH